MSDTNPIPADTISELDCMKGVDKIKKTSILKLDNRKRLANFVNITRLKGFNHFVDICFPDYYSKEIVKEMLDLTECIGCSEKFPYEDMKQDDAGEKYCQPCWDDLSPIFQEEYRQMMEEQEAEDNLQDSND